MEPDDVEPGDAPRQTLILASRSPVRSAMLSAAGVAHTVEPARVDEAEIKRSLLAEAVPPRDLADALADAKAARISNRRPEALVLAADQILALDGTVFDKPADLAEARRQLTRLRGRSHTLVSAAVAYSGGRPLWRHVGTARMTMRAFSDAFLDAYLATQGDDLLDSVGAYKLEAGGAVLFDRIDGDHFTILGLPLLPVLAFLRQHGLAAA